MDSSVRAGIAFTALAVGIILGIVSLAFQGFPYFFLAASIFGFIAGAFLATGLYLLLRHGR